MWISPLVESNSSCSRCERKLTKLHADLAGLRLTDRFDTDMPDEPLPTPTFRLIDYRRNPLPDIRSPLTTSAALSPKTSTPSPEPRGDHQSSEQRLPKSPSEAQRWSSPSPHSSTSYPRDPFEYDNLHLPSIREDIDNPEVQAHVPHPLDSALYNDFLAYLRTRGKKGHQGTRHARGITKPPVQTRAPNSKQAACRPAQIPRCKYGSHRVLNYVGDDVRNKVCWRHKARRGENDKDLPCESSSKDL
jgi:hypothetical protein